MSAENYYVKKVAETARRFCEDCNVISDSDRLLNREKLSNILSEFGGKLYFNDGDESYFKYINKDSFEVNMGSEIDNEDISITVLTALGIPFFAMEQLSEGMIIKLNNLDIIRTMPGEGTVSMVELFAREFLMPENDFDKCMAENLTDKGTFDCIKIANEYGTGYMKVMTRGYDLGKWY